uniref:Uncharacterized protein n=1 Tax=Ceratitis capitata TaxID=7213 RepID=W8B7D4_CERCA
MAENQTATEDSGQQSQHQQQAQQQQQQPQSPQQDQPPPSALASPTTPPQENNSASSPEDTQTVVVPNTNHHTHNLNHNLSNNQQHSNQVHPEQQGHPLTIMDHHQFSDMFKSSSIAAQRRNTIQSHAPIRAASTTSIKKPPLTKMTSLTNANAGSGGAKSTTNSTDKHHQSHHYHPHSAHHSSFHHHNANSSSSMNHHHHHSASTGGSGGGGGIGMISGGSGCDSTSNSIVRYNNDLNIFGSSESVGVMATPTGPQPSLAPQIAAAVNTVKINVEELLRENRALREKLKEVTADRDHLLCEVSNLRLELDMSALKQLPEQRYVSTSFTYFN